MSTPELRAAVERLTRLTTGEIGLPIYSTDGRFLDDITTVLSALAEMEKDAAIYGPALRPCLEYWQKAKSDEPEAQELINTMLKLCTVALNRLSSRAAIAAADAADREGKDL